MQLKFKTLKELESLEYFIKRNADIDFEISSSKLCEGTGPVAKTLTELTVKQNIIDIPITCLIIKLCFLGIFELFSYPRGHWSSNSVAVQL